MGGSFNIVNQTGAIEAGIGKIALGLKGKETLMIPIIVFIFSLGGATIGIVEMQKMIALVGPEVKNPQYFNVLFGACVSSIVQNNVNSDKHLRFISGNILTGTTITSNGYLGAYDNLISVIEEGDYYEFLGWITPGIKKFSLSRTFLSGFCNLLPSKLRRTAQIDTNLHGGKRALVLTGEYEKVLPLDIYPMQLIKACIIEDIDLMDNWVFMRLMQKISLFVKLLMFQKQIFNK